MSTAEMFGRLTDGLQQYNYAWRRGKPCSSGWKMLKIGLR